MKKKHKRIGHYRNYLFSAGKQTARKRTGGHPTTLPKGKRQQVVLVPVEGEKENPQEAKSPQKDDSKEEQAAKEGDFSRFSLFHILKKKEGGMKRMYSSRFSFLQEMTLVMTRKFLQRRTNLVMTTTTRVMVLLLARQLVVMVTLLLVLLLVVAVVAVMAAMLTMRMVDQMIQRQIQRLQEKPNATTMNTVVMKTSSMRVP